MKKFYSVLAIVGCAVFVSACSEPDAVTVDNQRGYFLQDAAAFNIIVDRDSGCEYVSVAYGYTNAVMAPRYDEYGNLMGCRKLKKVE